MADSNTTTAAPKKEQRSGAKSGARMLSNTELSAFCGQMALVLHSGISAYEGITIMRDDAADDEDRAILTKITEGMERIGYVAPALKEAGVFPDYMISMVEIGERTGTLDDVMQSLEEHYAREEAIRKSTQNAVFYPLILSGMMIAVIIVLLVKVMPVFNDVFKGLGAEMTGFPALLVRVGEVLRQYSLIFILILFVIILLIFVFYRTDKGREAARRFMRRFPGVRKSNHDVAACRFAGAMSMTLSAGLTPEEGLELAEKLNDDPDFSQLLGGLKRDLEEGKNFSESLYNRRIFSGIYARMVSIGQKTGSMDQVMGQIADMYQDDIDTRLSNRLATLEPLLVIIMSAAIGAILLTVMFPLLGIMSSI